MFKVNLYYDKYYRGLAETETAPNEDRLREVVHDFANRGGYIQIVTPGGNTEEFDSDTYWEIYYYEGEVDFPIPTDYYQLAE